MKKSMMLIGGLLVLIWYGLEQALTPKWALSSALGVLALYVAMPDGLQREARARPAAPSFAAYLSVHCSSPTLTPSAHLTP